MKRLVAFVIVLAIPASASAERRHFSASVSGHLARTEIARTPITGANILVTLGGERPDDDDEQASFIGGSIGLFLARTPQHRMASAVTTEFNVGHRWSSFRMMFIAQTGLVMVERSTNNTAQTGVALGIGLGGAFDVVRWRGGGWYVEGRGVLGYGLPTVSLGTGVRF